jgi:signal transduction histidine kinase
LKEISGKKIFDVTNIENQVLNIAKGLKTESDKPISPQIETKAKEDLSKTIKNSTAIIKNEEGKIVGTISLPTDIAKLREIDQLKNDFISTMTHELRSPLTSIKMALDLVSRENLSPDISNMINAAIRNSERLNSIISDILDFSKLQSGKMTFNLIDNDPIEIANEAIDSMKAWSKSKNIDLTLDKSATLPKIYCDKKRTEQILINLISNSLKFTATNGKITVSVYQKENDSNFVFFSVKDNGCGIKKEDLSKIFEKFVQALSGEKLGGTGLGLAITKAMVVMQGGNIYVESEYGKGSNFIFTIPVYRKSNESFKPKEEKTKSWWQKLFRI